MFRPGDIVRISDVILRAGMRAETVPEDTRGCDFVMRLTGVLVDTQVKSGVDFRSRPGDRVVIRTAAGRLVEGVLDSAVPGYDHTFGPVVSELAWIGPDARRRVTEYLG